MNITTIETERLRIEPLTLNDSGFILKLLNTDGWLKYIGDRNVKDNAAAQNYIQNILNNRSYFCNVFRIKKSGKPVGIITFSFREEYRHPDIGFAMLPEYGKMGYAYEATRNYMAEITREKNFDRILGITLTININSRKLLEKLGLSLQEVFLKDGQELALYEKGFI